MQAVATCVSGHKMPAIFHRYQVVQAADVAHKLEPLLKIPYLLSPGWLKVDPTFDPLPKNPRFQKLVAGAK